MLNIFLKLADYCLMGHLFVDVLHKYPTCMHRAQNTVIVMANREVHTRNKLMFVLQTNLNMVGSFLLKKICT